MSYRSSPSFAIGGVHPEFRCLICGGDVGTHHHLEVRGICEQHCEDHDYLSEERGAWPTCAHCNAYAPDDFYDVDFDGDFGIGSYEPPSGPLGTPASSMNGNAAVANTSPEARAAWDNWVAFCERCGHP